jgi:hypothetical protein
MKEERPGVATMVDWPLRFSTGAMPLKLSMAWAL